MQLPYTSVSWTAASCEWLNRGRHTIIGAETVLYDYQSPWQHIVIADVPDMGRGLFLDGNVQLLTEGERTYHERVARWPVLLHAKPEHVLILGGGDGCAAREVLKDRRVQQITLVERDAFVITACEAFLADTNEEALRSDRVKIVVDDALEYLEPKTIQAADVAIVDFLDAYDADELALYEKVLQKLATHGRPDLIVSLHGDLTTPPYWPAARIWALARKFFYRTLIHRAFVNCYAGEWGFVLGSQRDDLDIITPDIASRFYAAPFDTLAIEHYPSAYRLTPDLIRRLGLFAEHAVALPPDYVPGAVWTALSPARSSG